MKNLHRRLVSDELTGLGLAIARGLGSVTNTPKTALAYLKSALKVLDESNAPPHIGAHVDLVISRLEEAIAGQEGIRPVNRRRASGSDLP